MAIVGPSLPISTRQKRITFQNPGAAVPDGDGGFTQSWTDLPPPAFANVSPATVASLEHAAAGTILSTATHIVTVPYRGGVSTKTRILVDGRVLNVTSVQDPDERHVDLVLVCAEVVP
jgi:SPP1 family predicted phage head-tail adaptor